MKIAKKKKTTKKFEYLSPLEAIHESASALHNANVIDTPTMHEFDSLCSPAKEAQHQKLKKHP